MPPTRAPLGSRRFAAAMVALASLACDFPLAANRFQIDRQDPPKEVLEEGDWLELVDGFADGNEECKVRLSERCRTQAEECASDNGCFDFTLCVRSERNPGATAHCRSKHNTTLGAQWAYENLRACWAGEPVSCEVGRDFDCTRNYLPPSVEPRSEIQLRQRFRYINNLPPGDTFELSVCGLTPDCTAPALTALSDETGTINVSIPIQDGSTWNGARVVTGARIQRSYLRQNLPVWGDGIDVTWLHDLDLVKSYQGDGASELAIVFVELVDCQGGPAAGFWIKTDQGRVTYGDTGYVTTGNGKATVSSLSGDRSIHVRAVRDPDHFTAAEYHVSLGENEAMYLKLYPEPSTP